MHGFGVVLNCRTALSLSSKSLQVAVAAEKKMLCQMFCDWKQTRTFETMASFLLGHWWTEKENEIAVGTPTYLTCKLSLVVLLRNRTKKTR